MFVDSSAYILYNLLNKYFLIRSDTFLGPNTEIMIAVLVILIILSAFFSSAETALTTVNKINIKSLAKDGHKTALILLKLLDNPSKFLSAILIGNNIVNISASALATVIVQTIWGDYAITFATGALTIVVLIFGEITPKTIATLHADKISLSYARIIYFLMVTLTPVIIIINKLSSTFMFFLGVNTKKKQSLITEGELRTIVDVSHEEGIIESEEREMIKNVFDFGDAKARDVMIPRIDMCMVDVNISYNDLILLFKKNKYTRFPVYSESTDNVIGIINIKDLLLYKHNESFNIKNYLRQAYFTYEYKNLTDLMFEMKKASVNIIIVLDEYGAASGLITIEDLIEEIVGEIRDEYDYDEEDDIRAINEKEFIIEGHLPLDDFNKTFNTQLISDDYDSIGGYIMGALDRLPIVGDTIENENFLVVVDSLDKNRIEKIHVYIKDIISE